MAAIALADTIEDRVLGATLRCLARWGVAKTTLDDVAREAGCSRASVYRAFPGGKDALVAGLLATEVRRFGIALQERLAGIDDVETLLVDGIAFAARYLTGHEALQFLLAHEPEVILPRIAFHHMNEVLGVASDLIGPFLVPHVGEEEAPRAAEWVARLVFSYTLSPSDVVDVRDEESVRALVRDFVLPGLIHRATTT